LDSGGSSPPPPPPHPPTTLLFQDLDEVVGAALEFYEEKKLLQYDPLPLALEKDKDSRLLTSPLKFPGKLAIDVQNNRLFISDSNHNRIVSISCFTFCLVSTDEANLLNITFYFICLTLAVSPLFCN
jgi:hypothetical protein